MADEATRRMAAIAAVLSLVESGDDASQRGRQRGEAWAQDCLLYTSPSPRDRG